MIDLIEDIEQLVIENQVFGKGKGKVLSRARINTWIEELLKERGEEVNPELIDTQYHKLKRTFIATLGYRPIVSPEGVEKGYIFDRSYPGYQSPF